MERAPRKLKILMMLYFLSGLIWISGWTCHLVAHGPQGDFFDFYSTGFSVRDGYSPYDNNMAKDIRTWDYSSFANSGFLLPPLTARLFVPFTYFRYARAKLIWTLLIFSCIVASIAAATYVVWLDIFLFPMFAVLGTAFWFYPTVSQIEAANIDGITFFVITMGFFLACRFKENWAHCALGACLAVATFLKLDTLLFMPGIFLTRWRPTLVGFLLGVAVLFGSSLALDGISVNQDYFMHRLGRIFQSEELGSENQSLSSREIQIYSRAWPDSINTIDGVIYDDSGLMDQNSNGSGTREMASRLHISRLLIMIFTPLLLWALTFFFARGTSPDFLDPTLTFYYFGILITLFCAPFTWMIRLFWVIALLPWVLKNMLSLSDKRLKFYFTICVICIEMIGIPVPYFYGSGIYYPLFLFLLTAFIWKILTSSGSKRWPA